MLEQRRDLFAHRCGRRSRQCQLCVISFSQPQQFQKGVTTLNYKLYPNPNLYSLCCLRLMTYAAFSHFHSDHCWNDCAACRGSVNWQNWLTSSQTLQLSSYSVHDLQPANKAKQKNQSSQRPERNLDVIMNRYLHCLGLTSFLQTRQCRRTSCHSHRNRALGNSRCSTPHRP